MYKLGEIIKRNKKSIAKSGYDYYEISDIWQDVVDGYLAKKTCPTKLISGKLYVNVLEPIWAQQLNLLKKNIIEKVNKRIGKTKITNIQFQIGYIEPDNTETKNNREDKTKTKSKNKKIKDNILQEKNEKNILNRIYKKNEKYKKAMKEKGYKECVDCGIIYLGEKNICNRCQQIKKYDKIKKLIKNLQKTPWIKPEEMGVKDEKSYEDFLLCKSILIREKEERLRSCIAYKKELSNSEKIYLKGIAQEFVELKTGFKPYEITEIIMKNNLPFKTYKMLFEERKHL